MRLGMRVARRGLLLALTAGLNGCLAAAAAGAGGAIVFSGHEAEAIVERSVDEMADVAQRVMETEGIRVTDTRSQDSGRRRVFEGEKDELDITVTIEENDEGTKIGVEAQRSTTSWNDDYARSLLAKIIA